MKGEMAALSIDGGGIRLGRMVKQVGDFLGQFLDYDAKPISLGYCSYMRFKVRIHVRNLLKRRKKIVLVNKIVASSCWLREDGEGLQLGDMEKSISGNEEDG
ncbi:hypothetical protein Goari_014828 [Gossypium aridum]|uniref:Uncharacterized protein n=1 Tax=Gossypium aridum TaxID=34290 RepID=A0A7J8XKJ4_GOSAI|nr:hypothetical protein [Gossypium aridum]